MSRVAGTVPHRCKATLLYVPADGVNDEALFATPSPVVTFGEGLAAEWKGAGLRAEHVYAEIPDGVVPHAEWGNAKIPDDPRLNVSAMLAVRVALDVAYGAGEAVEPPKDRLVYFTGEVTPNGGVAGVGGVFNKMLVVAAASMLASPRTSGAELDAVLVLPQVSAMPAASLRTAVASFNERVWKLSLHGRDCSIRASFTDDERLRVSAEAGATLVGSCRVGLRPVTNIREVWKALEQEGGRRLPSTAVGRNGHFESRLGKWSLAIMASILMLLPLLYVRRVENPGTLPAPAPLPAPIAAPVPGPVAKRPRPALAPRPIPAPTPKPDLPAPAPLPKPAPTFVLRCPNSPSKRCSEKLEAAEKILARDGFTGEVQMKDCNQPVDLGAVIAPSDSSKYVVENTLQRECDL